MTTKGATPLDHFLAETAARQHGVVALWQILAAGYGRDPVKTRMGRKRLHTVQRGVYAVGHVSITGDARWMAAVLSLGPAAALSHRSAAALRGLADAPSSVIDVTVPATSGRKRREGIRVHRAAVERTTCRGIPVTTVARTLLDLAAVAPQRTVDRAVDAAERQGVLDLRAIEALPLAGHHGTGKLRAAIANYDGAPTDGELERLFLELCRTRGLPLPVSNAAVAGYGCDFLWPRHRLVVEVDGGTHTTRRQQALDREKDAALVLAGYRVHRFVWRQVVHRPDEVDATVRALLAAAV